MINLRISDKGIGVEKEEDLSEFRFFTEVYN